MLMQRIMTAMILIPIILGILFFTSPFVFFILTTFIALNCAWEWSHLMEIKPLLWRLFYVACSGIILIITLTIPVLITLFCSVIAWFFFIVLLAIYPRGSDWWSRGVFWRVLMGWFVFIPTWVAINFLRTQPNGIHLLLFLFILVWGADSAAYFIGKKWGKTKFAPSLSPGKSVQGVLAALVFSIGWVVLVLWAVKTPLMVWPYAIGLVLITVLFSVVGDLFESMLKRQACLKDSGCLFPGHGGLLDRIDSLTAAAPIFASGGILMAMFV